MLPKALRGRSDKELGLLAPGGPALQSEMPSPVFNFDGISNLFGGWPPDTQGDIGPNHYVQWINLHFAIWQIDRVNLTASLSMVRPPGNTLFQGFGGPCQNTNHGDPITLYDPFAERWLMSQFALPNYPNGPFYQCVAVSTELRSARGLVPLRISDADQQNERLPQVWGLAGCILYDRQPVTTAVR